MASEDDRPDSWSSRGGHERAHPYDDFEDDFEDRVDVCHSCDGDGERGYEECEYVFPGSPYEAGPHGNDDEGTLGCPRMTGTF